MTAVWPRTLRARLTVWYTALLSGMLAALGLAALMLLERGLRDNIDASLDSVARAIADTARTAPRFGPGLDEILESFFFPGFSRRSFRMLDPLGRPDPRVAPRGRLQFPISPQALENAKHGRATYTTISLPDVSSAPVRLLTVPVFERGRLRNFIQVAMSLDSAETARSRFLFVLLGLAPLALGGAGIGGWFLARRALAPVNAMVEAARRIEAEDLSQRLETHDQSDELGRLASVLNDMLARLERSFSAVRHFSADAAHELRTPLTILKGEMEVALRASQTEDEYRQVLGSCLEEVDRLSALVNDLLFLARSDSGGLDPALTSVNLAEVIEEARPALLALAERKAVGCRISSPAAVWVRGNASMLFRLIFNLGENALKYTPAGGQVDLRLTRQADRARLEVQDTGPGIAAEDREQIFERFYRADAARTRGGTGLGLALVRSIVLLHQGRIGLDSEVGRGSRFWVVLPLDSDARTANP